MLPFPSCGDGSAYAFGTAWFFGPYRKGRYVALGVRSVPLPFGEMP